MTVPTPPRGLAGPNRATVLEAGFLLRRQEPARLAAAVAESMASVTPQLPAAQAEPLRAAALGIAVRVADWASARAEHAYHNRHHVAETVLAVGALAQEAMALHLVTPRGAACAVVAMAGHDLQHDGSVPGGGRMEARALRAVSDLLDGLPAADRTLVADLILATDPDRVGANAAAAEATEGASLRRLANEADVFASLLPRLGPQLGRQLAAEWRQAGAPPSGPVGTARGRLAFLRAYPPLSPPALRLGLGAARDRSISLYAAVAEALGLRAVPEAGAEALDHMPEAAADRAYQAALRATEPGP